MTTMLMRERPAPEWSHLRLCAWIVAMLDVAPRNGFARAATELYGGFDPPPKRQCLAFADALWDTIRARESR